MMHCNKFVFIHIPRTGGTSLTETFGVLPAVSKCVYEYKHATAREIRRLIGAKAWNNAYKFTVYRDPYEIIRSWYQHCLGFCDNGYASPDWLSYVDYVRTCSFNTFVELEVLSGRFVQRGGFLSTFCNLPDINVLSLAEAHDKLVEMTGYQPALPRVNASKPISIDDSCRKVIQEFCCFDYLK